ncbi:MAG: hypothetical protein V1885_02095 [Candidatus Brennerbacteria bacterium]
MARTSRDAARHIREWSEFFHDANVVAEAVVDEFIARHRKNKHLRQSLRRLIANGIVRKKEERFSVTPKGIIYLLKRSPNVAGAKKWDGKWRLVSFDVPVRSDKKRQQLRYFLKRFDFHQLQKSVYVCPSHMSEEFWRLMVEYDLERYCKVMLVEIIEGDEELRKIFKLPPA